MTKIIVWGASAESCHGLFISPRRILERDRTVAAARGSQTQGRSSTNLKSCGTRWHRVHSSNRSGVENAAKRIGLRQWRHLLAPAPRLDQSRGLGGSPSALAQSAWPCRPDRSAAGRSRQPVGACCFWGDHTGPNPTDRAKNGCKRHLITDTNGLPLVVHTTAANVHDSVPALNLLDCIPPICGPRGRPRQRPDIYQGDAAYGTPTNLQGAKERKIAALMARPGQRKAGQTHGSGLGRFRYVVERTLVWFGHNRRLKICYEKTQEHFQAFHELAAGLICARRLASRGF